MSRSTLDTALSLLPSLTGLSPFTAGLSSTVLLGSWISHAVRTPVCTHTGLGSFHFARRYFGNRIFSFSSSGYLDVSVHRVPGLHLWIQYRPHEVCSCRFPHSDIHGSRVICTSPWLFAAYHVFHRLPVPRHSPCALVRLTFQTFSWNIWYPLDSLLPTKIIVTLPFEIVIFLKKELTIIFVSQLLFSFQGTSLSVLFRALKIEQYLLKLLRITCSNDRPS